MDIGEKEVMPKDLNWQKLLFLLDENYIKTNIYQPFLFIFHFILVIYIVFSHIFFYWLSLSLDKNKNKSKKEKKT